MKDVHDAEFDNKVMEYAEEEAVCGNSKRAETVVLLVPSAKRLYLEMQEGYFSENMKRRLTAVLGCFIVCCCPNEKMFQMMKRLSEFQTDGRSSDAENGSQTGEGTKRLKTGSCEDWSYPAVDEGCFSVGSR